MLGATCFTAGSTSDERAATATASNNVATTTTASAATKGEYWGGAKEDCCHRITQLGKNWDNRLNTTLRIMQLQAHSIKF